MKHRILRFIRYDFERILTFGYISKIPQRQIALGYLSYILFGTLLLMLPFSLRQSVSCIDNLFVATSAISTTGLSTVSVADSYTLFGQIVILLMIQMGGLGYMTMSSFFLYRTTKHFMRIKNGVMRASFSMPQNVELQTMVQSIIGFTLLFEITGTIALYIAFLSLGIEDPLWSAVFHAVSSFGTAGFSIYNNSLEQFKGSVSVNLIVGILSYAGAMGFIVMNDLFQKCRARSYRITFTTKIIVLITGGLTLFGSLQLFFLEPDIVALPMSERVMASLFQTMSAMTTVGYNTIPLNQLLPISAMILIVVMYIGASPSGTGGGLKSTTASAVFAFVKTKLGMKRDVTLFGHRLPTNRVDQALVTFSFYTTILFAGLYLLSFTEQTPLLPLFFEAASALGTVGLSMGITSSLSVAGKLIITVLMYIGRVGVLTFGTAMLMRMERKEPNEEKEKKEDDIAV